MSARYNFSNIQNVAKSFYLDRGGDPGDLDQHLARGGSICIYGIARVGKSAVAHHCAEVFGKLKDATVSEVNFKGVDFDRYSEVSLRDQFKEKLGDILEGGATRRLVVVDEIDNGLTTWTERSQLVDFFNLCTELMDKDVQFLMAGQMLPERWKETWPEVATAFPARENFWDVEIKPFTERELVGYCRHSEAPVGNVLIKWIYEKTGGLAGPVNAILQRYNQLFRRTGKSSALVAIANDSVVKGTLAKFTVPGEKTNKPAEKVGKKQRLNAGGRTSLPTGRFTDGVTIAPDRKKLSVARAPSKSFRITNQEAWNFIDALLKRAKNNADKYLMLESKTKRVFRRGDARRFIDECIEYRDQEDPERTPRPPVLVRFKKKFL